MLLSLSKESLGVDRSSSLSLRIRPALMLLVAGRVSSAAMLPCSERRSLKPKQVLNLGGSERRLQRPSALSGRLGKFSDQLILTSPLYEDHDSFYDSVRP